MTIHTIPGAAFLDRLAAGLGPGGVTTDPDELAPHLAETRGLYRGSALALVRPRTTQEVAFAVGECARAGVPVVPHGGNTGLVGAGVPEGGIVLSLARLDRIRALDAANATMTVEAGCILKNVQDAAAGAGLMFPLSLASEGSCRIGGNIATNAGGTAVLRYGNTRDLVLGLEVVLADGRVLNGLNTLRKDNTGYDLRNLFIGAEGTLGIVTAAVLKLYPKLKSRLTAFVGCASAGKALALFQRLREGAAEDLIAFEYMDRFSLEIVLRHAAGAVRPLGQDHEAYALIELASARSDADLRERLEEILAAAIEEGLAEDATIGASEAQNRAIWHLRESLSEVQGKEGGSIKHDVSVPVSRVAEFVEAANAACIAAMPGIRPCAFGHVGDGNVHYNLSQPVGMDKAAYLAAWPRFNRLVHDLVASFGGSISAEHGIGLMKRDELLHYKDPVALDLMRVLKRSLDPLNILNPGKVIALEPGRPEPAARATDGAR